jgi:integrative and conjugative element protein (TIGR02256 family)
MISLILPKSVQTLMLEATRKAGWNEVGGVLMAEHMGHNIFKVCEITVHRRGAFASFVRRIEDAINHIQKFFDRKESNYIRFNYLGEWHSHPSFEPTPSSTDDASMREIVGDRKVGANFVVLLIVKLVDKELIGTAHTYLPTGEKYRSQIQWTD